MKIPKLLELLSKKKLPEILNMLCMIAMMAAIVLVFILPANNAVLMLLFAAGGISNIINGYRMLQDKKRRNLGKSMILMGAMILFLGYYVFMVVY